MVNIEIIKQGTRIIGPSMVRSSGSLEFKSIFTFYADIKIRQWLGNLPLEAKKGKKARNLGCGVDGEISRTLLARHS
jgi:hypothetical protein